MRFLFKEYINLKEFMNLWYGDDVINNNYVGAIYGIYKNNTWKTQNLYEFLTKDGTVDSTQVAIYSQYDFIKYDTDTSQYYSDLKTNILFNSIRQRFQDSFIVYPKIKDVFPTEAFIDNFLSILANTYKKYSLIIDKFEAKKDDILKGITSTSSQTSSSNSKNRFNDTPQTKEVDGETFIDEDYTSNINLNDSSASSSITSESDRDLLIERLVKVERELDDIYLTWSNEFRRLFK